MRVTRDGGVFTATPERPGDRLRLVLLISDDPQQRYLRDVLAARFEVAAVVVEPSAAQQRRLRVTRRWRAYLWRGYQILRQRLTGRAAYRRSYFRAASVAASRTAPAHGDAGRRRPSVLTVDWINAPAVRALLDDVRPDVLVVCGTSYIRPGTIAGPPLAINVHGGVLPWYRGNHGVYFAFEAGDFARVGASLHLVTADLDGGELLDVVRPPFRPGDQDERLYCRAFRAATRRLEALLARLEQGGPLPVRPQSVRTTPYRHRDRTPWRELRLLWRRLTGAHAPLAGAGSGDAFYGDRGETVGEGEECHVQGPDDHP
ncbi:formyl transferase [Thermopolyspora sp. NPDC052614]|uniref:formyl transferase n=1 Tax=Thermopolyspora sp. NPDC052614 TaxID=3155682 RepID=UPI003432BCCC